MVTKDLTPIGYKNSEVGLIPNEWDIYQIGDEIKSLDAGVSVNSVEVTVNTGEAAILKTSSIYQGKFIPNESKKIIKKDIKRARLNPKKDSIIISRMNTPDLVGACAYIDKDYKDLYIPDRLWQTTSKINSKLDIKWLNYLLNSRKYRKIIKDMATGTSNSMKNITKAQILSLKIPFPNLAEQKAIATALSDMDDLILSLEKLISKKKSIKQGAMEELLTGKKRLDGFNDNWSNKPLGDIVNIRKGQMITEELAVKGTIPVIAGGKKPAYYHNKANRFGNTITISASGANAGYISYYDVPIYASDCSTIEEGNGYSIQFIYQQLKLRQSEIYKMQTGGAQPHIHPSDLEPIIFTMPNNCGEQEAIATILSDMDNEIEKLQKKLDKYKNIKSGMMEKLLTGERRLV